jgi:hypothetical protein
VLAHYGVVALPCRVGDPDRKGKVESAIGHTQATPLKGLRFESLADGQAYLDRWDARWTDTRIHGTTKRQVVAVFAEERPTLLPLPVEPFRYYRYGTRTVHLDGCVEVERAYYAAPSVVKDLPVRFMDAAIAFWKISELSAFDRTSRAWISVARTATIPGPSATNSPNGEWKVVLVMSPSVGTRSSILKTELWRSSAGATSAARRTAGAS